MNAATDDTAIYANGRTYAEHCAWLDSLEGDEYRIVYMPPGHLFNLAYVAYFKHALLTMKMTAGEQMKILDGIASMVYGPVTAEAIEVIEPACATAVQMLHELHKVHITQQTRAFIDGDVFRLLTQLNPSLLRALELCRYNEPVPKRRSA
jgi:hypothetical protein